MENLKHLIPAKFRIITIKTPQTSNPINVSLCYVIILIVFIKLANTFFLYALGAVVSVPLPTVEINEHVSEGLEDQFLQLNEHQYKTNFRLA